MFSRQYKHLKHTSGKKQTGVAIITALLIVTIAATVSISISTKLQLDVRRTGNLIALDQADIYASFIEKFTQKNLENADNLKELMSTLRKEGKFEAIYPIVNGTVEGVITDLNSCINLNSLIDTSVTPAAVNSLVQARLMRVFANNNIPTTMTSAIADWIDEDLNTTSPPNGAEDGHYLNLEQPYRTANQELTSITELRLIKGADNPQDTPSNKAYNNILFLAEAFTKNPESLPTLCAFKANGPGATAINLNTASKQVLLSLSAGMTETLAKKIIDCRRTGSDNFLKFDDLSNCDSSINTIITAADRGLLVYDSEYFLLKTKVSVGDAKKITYSIIFLNPTGKTEIISRTQRTL